MQGLGTSGSCRTLHRRIPHFDLVLPECVNSVVRASIEQQSRCMGSGILGHGLYCIISDCAMRLSASIGAAGGIMYPCLELWVHFPGGGSPFQRLSANAPRWLKIRAYNPRRLSHECAQHKDAYQVAGRQSSYLSEWSAASLRCSRYHYRNRCELCVSFNQANNELHATLVFAI